MALFRVGLKRFTSVRRVAESFRFHVGLSGSTDPGENTPEFAEYV